MCLCGRAFELACRDKRLKRGWVDLESWQVHYCSRLCLAWHVCVPNLLVIWQSCVGARAGSLCLLWHPPPLLFPFVKHTHTHTIFPSWPLKTRHSNIYWCLLTMDVYLHVLSWLYRTITTIRTSFCVHASVYVRALGNVCMQQQQTRDASWDPLQMILGIHNFRLVYLTPISKGKTNVTAAKWLLVQKNTTLLYFLSPTCFDLYCVI